MKIENRLMAAFIAGGMLCVVPPPARAAATLPPGFTDVKIAGGLNPTIMMFAPDGRLFLNEKDGKIRIVKDGALLPAPFATVETDPVNERGLLGIDFDPGFSDNHFVYVFYTTKSAPQRNRISRFTAKGDVAAGPETVIFDMTDLSAAGNHNGGTIRFGKDGKLYIASGNNANNGFSQSNANLHGKLLRINPDGTIPEDNPFAGSLTGKNRAIWALGLRNPFTFAIQPGTGRIFVNDVGGSAIEEVTEVTPGTNLGWPNVEGNSGTPPVGPGSYKAPLLTYSHNSGNCAISGGEFFQPVTSTFPKEYTGRYFFADYCGGWIKSWNPEDGKPATDFASGIIAPINIKTGPDGQLYYLARGNDKSGAAANTASTLGELHRVKGPANPAVSARRPGGARMALGGARMGTRLALAWPPGATVASIYGLNGSMIGEYRKSHGSDESGLPSGVFLIRYRP